ncbi:glycosyltransferase family 2 protein [Yoonia sp. 208BN28-4]|uniref:glycosyltransferase family 2 protein n=1 Tax=Yoonia sp. 208BN28-4 TaxID=3126505 RepID=UPI003096BF0D
MPPPPYSVIAPPAEPHVPDWSDRLVAGKLIAPKEMRAARSDAATAGLDLADTLPVALGVSPLSVTNAMADQFGVPIVDLQQHPADVSLIAGWGPHHCLHYGVIPWRRAGACTIILTTRPDQFDRLRPFLESHFGPVRMALTTGKALTTAITSQFQRTLVHRAETRVAQKWSCRDLNPRRTALAGFVVMALLGLCLSLSTLATFAVLTVIALTVLVAQTILKLACMGLALRSPPPPQNPVVLAHLPTITMLVPLFKENEIADHLITRLCDLDYPHENLDLCLVLEASDSTTRAALSRTNLPPWIRAITVPEGSLQTKPRALNYALDFARGSIIGIWDAEDAPDPDQLRKVATRFANRGPQVACLQGVLDYYNAPVNWLTRCFTLEYASWFRVMLPGLARMGLVVPLGGTTLFFRRDIIEKLGGWDAHNVTEDADLGIRLVRQGYTTELLDTTTGEEANGRAWPWVKQRSRWIKGYAVTYGVHMRDPVRLYRDLGFKRFIGFQVQFLGALLSFVLAPLLLSFWMVPLGLPHPMSDVLTGPLIWTLAGVFALSEVTNLAAAAIGVKAAAKTWLIPWAISLHIYFPLAAVAAYKGILELAWKPFYWDKTTHGVLPAKDDCDASPQPQQPVRQASTA